MLVLLLDARAALGADAAAEGGALLTLLTLVLALLLALLLQEGRIDNRYGWSWRV